MNPLKKVLNIHTKPFEFLNLCQACAFPVTIHLIDKMTECIQLRNVSSTVNLPGVEFVDFETDHLNCMLKLQHEFPMNKQVQNYTFFEFKIQPLFGNNIKVG